MLVRGALVAENKQTTCFLFNIAAQRALRHFRPTVSLVTVYFLLAARVALLAAIRGTPDAHRGALTQTD